MACFCKGVSAKTMTDKEILILFAFRYALGRRTTAPSEMSAIIKTEIRDLDDFVLKVIESEIEHAIEYNMAGDERIDVPVWEELREFIVNEEKRREEQCKMQ